MLLRTLQTIVVASILLPGCSNTSTIMENTMKLSSTSYTDNSFIPVRYTRYGNNISPHFSWNGVPAQAQSLALIIDDPDAPKRTFTHLVAFNIDPTIKEFPEGVLQRPIDSARYGTNDFKQQQYDGPQPPPGKPHRYIATLYALDTKLDLPEGSSKAEVEGAMKDHILARAQLTGLYEHKES